MSDEVEDAEDGERENKRRVVDFGIEFGPDRFAVGWAFGVSTAHFSALDIGISKRLTPESIALRAEMRKEGASEARLNAAKRYYPALTRAAKPRRRFSVNDVFYEPHEVHLLVWSEGLPMLRRAVLVVEAQEDEDVGQTGWVRFEVSNYESGTVMRTTEHRLSQADFEDFLRTGVLTD